MNYKKLAWIGIVVCGAVVVAVWYFALVPASVNSALLRLCAHENETNCFKVASGAALEPFRKKEEADAMIAFFTVVLGVSTVILAISTIMLWLATANTLKHAKETTQRQLRAYVSIREVSVKGLNLTVGSKPMAHWRIQNHGQTPAYQMTTDIFVEFEREDWDATVHLPSATGPAFALDPGAHVTNNAYIVDEGLTQEMIDGIKAGSHTVHVHGVVHYRDAFGNAFLNTIWLKLDISEGEDAPGHEYYLRQADKGNDAT